MKILQLLIFFPLKLSNLQTSFTVIQYYCTSSLVTMLPKLSSLSSWLFVWADLWPAAMTSFNSNQQLQAARGSVMIPAVACPVVLQPRPPRSHFLVFLHVFGLNISSSRRMRSKKVLRYRKVRGKQSEWKRDKELKGRKLYSVMFRRRWGTVEEQVEG